MCHCYYHWSFYYDAAKQTNKETQNMMKSQRNVTYHKNKKKNTIDINITQMMVGKQWVKR